MLARLEYSMQFSIEQLDRICLPCREFDYIFLSNLKCRSCIAPSRSDTVVPFLVKPTKESSVPAKQYVGVVHGGGHR